jgi:glucose/arabinose dehydrogenase
MRSSHAFLASLIVVLASPGDGALHAQTPAPPAPMAATGLACEPDNAGLKLPDGFCAVIVADKLGPARHLTIGPTGDVYVRFRDRKDGKAGVVALRDTNGDGRADEQKWFTEHYGTGIQVSGEHLYVSTDDAVMRYPLAKGQLEPSGTPETLVSGMTNEKQHEAKSFALDDQGNLFVNIGAPSNACQAKDRTAGVPGQRPCPLLERAGGVWRFDVKRTGQKQADGQRYSTGIRNAVAISWNPDAKAVYIAQHGRDQVDTMWPKFFTAEQNAEVPAEEFLRLTEGGDFGWPYCYFDPIQQKRVQMPEYGGDGKTVGECEKFGPPLVAFPAHWGPNDLLFYNGAQFPAKYQKGAFIAFHGSWNRAPLPQAGYLVAFVPMQDGKPSGKYEVFADGFAGTDDLRKSGGAQHRPTGLAVGPDGSLYISDSVAGRIYRIVHRGGAPAAN